MQKLKLSVNKENQFLDDYKMLIMQQRSVGKRMKSSRKDAILLQKKQLTKIEKGKQRQNSKEVTFDPRMLFKINCSKTLQLSKALKVNSTSLGNSIGRQKIDLSEQDINQLFRISATNNLIKQNSTKRKLKVNKRDIQNIQPISHSFKEINKKKPKLRQKISLNEIQFDYVTLIPYLNIGVDKLVSNLPDIQQQHQGQLFSLQQYIIGKAIGSGPYANVRLGIHRITNKKVAIKSYPKDNITQPSRRKSVRRQIKIMQRLNHPNAIGLFEAFQSENNINIIMDYIIGTSLSNYLKLQMHQRLDQTQAKRVFKIIVQTIAYLHQFKIVHRDIKLQNILIDSNLTPKVIDFGFATCMKDNQTTKLFCGTPSYMAPEIVSRKQCKGEPTDIWALGVLLYVILTGSFPYFGQSDEQLYSKIKVASYSIPNLSQSIIDLLSRMFIIDPSRRITAKQILKHPWIKSRSSNLKALTKAQMQHMISKSLRTSKQRSKQKFNQSRNLHLTPQYPTFQQKKQKCLHNYRYL